MLCHTCSLRRELQSAGINADAFLGAFEGAWSKRPRGLAHERLVVIAGPDRVEVASRSATVFRLGRFGSAKLADKLASVEVPPRSVALLVLGPRFTSVNTLEVA